ncbi:MAG TPA: TlpA disulfide reductase family protein [Solirubrobacteraceae bacterium]
MTRPRLARWVALAVGVVAAGLIALLATRHSTADTAAASPLTGKPAPEVIASDLDGTTVRLSQYRGRYVVLNFFASWCTPCQREHDDLERFSARHGASGQGDARVVAVLFDDEPSDARDFFKARGGDWPVLVDPRGKVALDFGVRGPPESFLVDPDGFVLARVVGEVTDVGLDRLIAEAKAQRARRGSSP